MSCYRRPNVTAARVFLTIHLAASGSDTLLRHINALRWAVAATRRDHPCLLYTSDAADDHTRRPLCDPLHRYHHTTIYYETIIYTHDHTSS